MLDNRPSKIHAAVLSLVSGLYEPSLTTNTDPDCMSGKRGEYKEGISRKVVHHVFLIAVSVKDEGNVCGTDGKGWVKEPVSMSHHKSLRVFLTEALSRLFGVSVIRVPWLEKMLCVT
jgi:hypothetical protein